MQHKSVLQSGCNLFPYGVSTNIKRKTLGFRVCFTFDKLYTAATLEKLNSFFFKFLILYSNFFCSSTVFFVLLRFFGNETEIVRFVQHRKS